MKCKIIFISIFCVILHFINVSFADTTFSVTRNETALGPFVDFNDIDTVGHKFEKIPNDFFETNKNILATGLAISNSLGYPNSRGLVKPLPHFEAGFGLGGSVYKLNRYEDFDIQDDPDLPGFGVGGGLLFSTGLSEKMDITIKLFSLKWFYNFDKTYDTKVDNTEFAIKISGAQVLSLGTKFRYNLLEGSKRSYLANFGGINIGLALDFLYYRVNATVNYDNSQDIDFIIKDPFSNLRNENSISLYGNVKGDASFKTRIISITPDILVYFDVFYILSFYTGPAISLNTGVTTVRANATGILTNNDAVTIDSQVTGPTTLVAANQEIASAKLDSYYKLYPQWFIPKWIVGLEFNLWVVKFHVEASSILTGITESFTAHAGLRVVF